MKLKYYLRGLGIGIIVTTIILAISFSTRDVEMSDEEVIARARQLGMVMQEETEQNQTEETQADDGEHNMTTVPETEQMSVDSTEISAEQLLEQVTEPDTEPATEEKPVADTEPATEEKPVADTEPVTEEKPVADTEPATEEKTVADTAASTGVKKEGTYRLLIKKGDVCRVVCEELAAAGIISDAEAFRKYLFEIGYASMMGVGEYDIPYGLTREEVAEILKAGPIDEQQ